MRGEDKAMRSFIQVTNPAEIEATFRAFLLKLPEQNCGFIAAIHIKPGGKLNDKVYLGGIVIEGARPYGVSTDFTTGEKRWQYTDSDSLVKNEDGKWEWKYVPGRGYLSP